MGIVIFQNREMKLVDSLEELPKGTPIQVLGEGDEDSLEIAKVAFILGQNDPRPTSGYLER